MRFERKQRERAPLWGVDWRGGLALLVLMLAAAGLARADTTTLLAVGDIAFCSLDEGDRAKARKLGYGAGPGALATAALLEDRAEAILLLGDLAYRDGRAEEFRDCYDPIWGGHKARSYPVPGNHEYHSREAQPYFDYWGARAGVPGKGYYSFDLGAWHIIALNSNIDISAGSAQVTWLRGDLAASEAGCILAFAHHPRFSSGKHGDQRRMRAIYRALYDAGASLVLAGHDHHYERFAPLDPDGRLDRERGLRSFVVGTGGGELRPGSLRRPAPPHSVIRNELTWGLLELTLADDSYAWRFVPVAGKSFSDGGQAPCARRR